MLQTIRSNLARKALVFEVARKKIKSKKIQGSIPINELYGVFFYIFQNFFGHTYIYYVKVKAL
jgi:hypothetical protein